MTASIAPTLDGISDALAGYWRYPLRDEELTVLAAETADWPTLQPLATAVARATADHTDRPSMAKLLRDARFIRRQSEAAAKPSPTKAGCVLCRGDRWIRSETPDGDTVVTACPRCLPVTHDLQAAGAYLLDAPTTDHNPAVRHVLDRHEMETTR